MQAFVRVTDVCDSFRGRRIFREARTLSAGGARLYRIGRAPVEMRLDSSGRQRVERNTFDSLLNERELITS